ncbi:DNA/RNA nuclease SfsA [Methanolobus vulcani]|uniref:Sugar fermentation stimulation protein homolog n=1 Tax=Methanolobus vulcani TaxID=38026 RepID=A0A7Z8KR46_9EURY|nr:DNA/RNA nuclease SfsA [Methanolobus vulcani]TQD29226.1 DNA/RNA nuclease SfsA [Methanolobus vulcani]
MKKSDAKREHIVCNIQTDTEGILIERPNRFLAIVEIDVNGSKSQEKVHVHDPGRLIDILYPGNCVLLRKASNPKRKTGWDMIAGRIGEEWILINSAFHRQISQWILENRIIDKFRNIDNIIPEQRFGDSRLDFLLEEDRKKTWVEVKGCTLAENNVAVFPDAPTTRGKRHLEELIRAVDEGNDAAIIILVFRSDAKCFAPNRKIDIDFTETMIKAVEKGVMIFPLQFIFENNNIYYLSQIPLCLEKTGLIAGLVE